MMVSRKWLTQTQGFTLPEMLVVVIIIGVLAALMVPALLINYYKAVDKRVVSEMRTVVLAIGLYRVDYDFIPQSANYAELVTLLNSDIEGIAPIPVRDSWRHPLVYHVVSTSEYTLMSYGKDGQQSTPASSESFDPDADIIVVNGEFVAANR